jgi:FKBP-type peptidyl-prolyl cis-trans isomerase
MKSLLKSTAIVVSTGAVMILTSCDNKSTVSNVELSNAKDSMSYAQGVLIGDYFQQSEFKDVNYELFLQAIKEHKDSIAVMEVEEATKILREAYDRIQAEKSKENKVKNDEFFANNSKAEGIQVTESGVQYKALTPGTGENPGPNDTVVMHYRGTLIDGTMFDSSIKPTNSDPVEMPLGRMIPGFREGVMKMQKGGKYMMYIPSELGYGPVANGRIPGGSVLVFEIEVFDIIKAQ